MEDLTEIKQLVNDTIRLCKEEINRIEESIIKLNKCKEGLLKASKELDGK